MEPRRGERASNSGGAVAPQESSRAQEGKAMGGRNQSPICGQMTRTCKKFESVTCELHGRYIATPQQETYQHCTAGRQTEIGTFWEGRQEERGRDGAK